MQSMTLQGCMGTGGGERRITCHWRHVARASLDIEKDIIRLKKCLHRETKGEPRHGVSGLPNASFRVIAADNRCAGKPCLGEVTRSSRVRAVLTAPGRHSTRTDSPRGSNLPLHSRLITHPKRQLLSSGCEPSGAVSPIHVSSRTNGFVSLGRVSESV